MASARAPPPPPSWRASPAPSITDGFEVLVQLVIAAITTRPWSSVVSVPSSRVTFTGFASRSSTAVPPSPPCSWLARLARFVVGSRRIRGGERVCASLVVTVAELLSGAFDRTPSSDSRNAALALVRAIRSCGRLGPAIDGSTEPRSRSIWSEKVGSSASSVVEHPLLARVGVHELDRLGRATGELEVAKRLLVDREDRAR